MKKFRGQQIGLGRRPSPILLSEEFFHPTIYKLDELVVLLLINYIVQISLRIILLRSAALTTPALVEDIQPCLCAKCSCSLCVFLPFKVFFLKHRKPSALVILVSVAEILRKIW